MIELKDVSSMKWQLSLRRNNEYVGFRKKSCNLRTTMEMNEFFNLLSHQRV